MFIFRICMMAIRGLRANLFRSLLATLGVIIGVSAVVSAMAILEGANKDVVKQFESLGADQLWITNSFSRQRGRRVTIQSLVPEDVDAILEHCPDIKAAAPSVQGSVQVKFYSKNHPASLLGTSEAYAPMNEYKVEVGRFLRHDDVQSKREVVVLGHKVAKELFGESAPVGSAVRIHGAKSITFQVIGVMEKKGVLGFQDVDNQVIIPYTTAMRKLFGLNYLASITAQCSDAKQLDECSRQIKRTLRGEHHIRAGSDDDFELASQEQMKQSLGQMTQLFALVLYSIAGISLVVGGIGIMNIMMVSVTERTREIGVRMAVGARRFDIMRQFLIEAAIISFLGGALGVAFGMVLTDLLKNVTEELLSPYHSTRAMIWALGMASSVGVVSGLYPAVRASRLDPVEALRYE